MSSSDNEEPEPPYEKDEESFESRKKESDTESAVLEKEGLSESASHIEPVRQGEQPSHQAHSGVMLSDSNNPGNSN